jgi:hypothetical protein
VYKEERASANIWYISASEQTTQIKSGSEVRILGSVKCMGHDMLGLLQCSTVLLKVSVIRKIAVLTDT